MRFMRSVIENYRSFQLPTEISFPDNREGKSIFLIGGMKGTGKTYILDAMDFCHYRAKADEIFRNINRSNCLNKLNFE